MDFPMSKCLKLAGSNVKIRTYKSKVYYETNTKGLQWFGHQSRPSIRKSLRVMYIRPSVVEGMLFAHHRSESAMGSHRHFRHWHDSDKSHSQLCSLATSWAWRGVEITLQESASRIGISIIIIIHVIHKPWDGKKENYFTSCDPHHDIYTFSIIF